MINRTSKELEKLCLSHRRGLRFAFVGAAEDVELAAPRAQLALIDVDAAEIDVDSARPPESESTELKRGIPFSKWVSGVNEGHPEKGEKSIKE